MKFSRFLRFLLCDSIIEFRSKSEIEPRARFPVGSWSARLPHARRNPACDVDKIPSPYFILTPSKDALGSYRESNPSNFLCVSVFVFIPKKHLNLSSILRKMLLKCFYGIKTHDLATGGVGDSFVLLPRILGWGSFARAFLPPGG